MPPARLMMARFLLEPARLSTRSSRAVRDEQKNFQNLDPSQGTCMNSSDVYKRDIVADVPSISLSAVCRSNRQETCDRVQCVSPTQTSFASSWDWAVLESPWNIVISHLGFGVLEYETIGMLS